MAALTTPTVAQIVAFFGIEAGEFGAVGSMNQPKIENLISIFPTQNPVTKAVTYIRTLFTDPDNISAANYPFAFNAMMWAICYELLNHDFAAQQGIPNGQGGGILIDSYSSKMQMAASNVGVELLKLGIYESDYKIYRQGSVERIGGVREIGTTYYDNDYDYGISS